MYATQQINEYMYILWMTTDRKAPSLSSLPLSLSLSLPRVQVFLAILSRTHSADIIHKKGLCIWKGQCAPGECPGASDGGFYNVFNNSEAYEVTKNQDPDWYGLITDLCPLYAGKYKIIGVKLLFFNYEKQFCRVILKLDFDASIKSPGSKKTNWVWLMSIFSFHI